MLRRHKLRRYKVQPQEVNKLFPGQEPLAQKRLLAQRLHLDVDYRDGYFLIWSRSLVKFAFAAELVPYSPHDPDIETFQKGNCHMLTGEYVEFAKEYLQGRKNANITNVPVASGLGAGQ